MTETPNTEGIPEDWADVECPDCGSADVDDETLICADCGTDVDETFQEQLWKTTDAGAEGT